MSGPADILLAEDNENDAELTLRALTLGGVSAQQVTWVQDGEAALHYMFRKGCYAQRPPGNPRFVLLDLHMPKVDGLDVLERLKSDAGTRSTPIIVMSSGDQALELNRSYALSANSFVVKPVDFSEFTQLMTALARYWMQLNRASF